MKQTIVTTMIALMLILTACGGTQSTLVTKQPAVTETALITEEPEATENAVVISEDITEEKTRLNVDYDDAVSIEMQLLLGTLKLEGTDQAITAEQANNLLSLWMTYQTILQSVMPNRAQAGQGTPQQGGAEGESIPPDMGTPPAMPTIDPAVQTQLDDLITQIQAAMTDEQITAISDMKITSETAMTILQEQMNDMGVPQGEDGLQQPPQGGGQMPQGTPPAARAGAGSGTQGGPQGGMRLDTGMVQPRLVQAVITALQKIAGIEPTS